MEVPKDFHSTEPVSKSEGVPFMVRGSICTYSLKQITNKMKLTLEELGYPPSTVKKLEPVEAHFIVSNRVKFQPKKPSHIKHTLDDDKPSEPIILGASTTESAKTRNAVKSELE